MKRFLLIGFLFIVTTTYGQVNIERIRLDHKKETPSTQFVNLNTELQSGNSSFYSLNLNYRNQFQRDHFHGFLLSKFNYGKRNSDVYTNEQFAHLRIIGNSKTSHFNELYMQIESNQFIDLKARYLVGGGVRFRLIHQPSLHVFLGSSLLSEWLMTGADLPDDHIWRTSHYISHWAQLSEGNEWVSTVYFQPAIRDFKEYRFYLESSFINQLFDQVSYKTTFLLKYNTVPIGNQQSSDLALTSGIEWKSL